MKILTGLSLLLALFPIQPMSAQEVQRHGLVFEAWVRDTFFDGYKPTSYTQKWDTPAAANHAHGGVPVNPKAIKYGAPVDLGDALRQFAIAEPLPISSGSTPSSRTSPSPPSKRALRRKGSRPRRRSRRPSSR